MPDPAFDPMASFVNGAFDPAFAEATVGGPAGMQGAGFAAAPASGTASPVVRIPTGDELYNTLMQGIEPELTTDELPLLDERYKNETPAQSQERAKRYERAFAEYDRQLQAYMSDLKAKLRAHQRIAMSSAELGAKAEEEDALTAIESNIAKN